MENYKQGWCDDYVYNIHYKDDLPHREDDPAVIWRESSYYLEGRLFPSPKSDLDWLLTVKKWREDKNDKSKV
jgi:hypothetical protein